jgi:hypothetical protein
LLRVRAEPGDRPGVGLRRQPVVAPVAVGSHAATDGSFGDAEESGESFCRQPSWTRWTARWRRSSNCAADPLLLMPHRIERAHKDG